MREAVKHFDVSKPTLLKDLNRGKVSGVKDDAGQWVLDPSELGRVYRARSSSTPLRAGKVGQSAANLTGQIGSKEQAMGLASSSDASGNEVASLKVRLQEAETALAVITERVEAAERLREAAERLAEERAARIDDLRRMLPPPPTNETLAQPRPLGGIKGWLRSLIG